MEAALAHWQPSDDATKQFLVGWLAPSTPPAYMLARVNAAGQVLEGPVDVAAKARWGQRDDPFRAHASGDVVWSWFDAVGGTTLHVARVRSGTPAVCNTP